MNLSRNFTVVQPGRYQSAINRTVDILDSEIIPDPAHPNDRSKDKRRWRGSLLKADNKTVENTLHFEDDGSLWGVKTTSTPQDLKSLLYPFETPPAEVSPGVRATA